MDAASTTACCSDCMLIASRLACATPNAALACAAPNAVGVRLRAAPSAANGFDSLRSPSMAGLECPGWEGLECPGRAALAAHFCPAASAPTSAPTSAPASAPAIAAASA
eukprot:5301215-Prymnesium_polylepis.1